MTRFSLALVAAALPATLTGLPLAGPASAPGFATDSVVIRFAARVGDQPFVCGRDYPGIGKSQATISALDFRMYLSDVHLLTAKGKAVPVKLAQDGRWQLKQVALLDFENNQSPCLNGTEDTRLVVEGVVPPGDYRGVRFTLGVPFGLNHRNLVEQPSPLNLTSLFWVWRAGYKFLRLDVKTDTPLERLFLHLGSTGCVARDTLPSSPAIRCANPNRATITLGDFEAGSDTVVADVAALFADADLSVNQAKTAMGCMSAPDDGDCAPIFASLGLPFGATEAHDQHFFRVVKGHRP